MNIFKKQFDESAQWEVDVVHHVKTQRKYLYWLCGGLLMINILQAISFISIFPLEKKVPYVIEVEKSSGHIEIRTDLSDDVRKLKPSEAIIESFIYQYITAWKTFEYSDHQKRGNLIRTLSDKKVYNEYYELWSNERVDNPYREFSENDKATVKVLTILPLNETTHQARIRVDEVTNNGRSKATKYFGVIIKHKLLDVEMSQGERWVTPIGFQVTSIRFDEEYLD